MGTNFYYKENPCPCCKRFDRIQIGKKSYKWAFMFREYENLKSFSDWKKFLKDKEIVDEDNREISFNDFVKKVETTKSGKTLVDYYKEAGLEIGAVRIDEEGYSFDSREFS